MSVRDDSIYESLDKLCKCILICITFFSKRIKSKVVCSKTADLVLTYVSSELFYFYSIMHVGGSVWSLHCKSSDENISLMPKLIEYLSFY